MKFRSFFRSFSARLALLMTFVFLATSCGGRSLAHLSRPGNPEEYNHYLNSTVALVELTSGGNMVGPLCSGFFISPRRLATAHHCVEDRGILVEVGPHRARRVQLGEPEPVVGRTILFVDATTEAEWLVQDEDERTRQPNHHTATVVAADEQNDLAVLELVDSEDDWANWVPLRNLEEHPVEVGERVFAVSNPVGETFILSEGIVSRVQLVDTTIRILHQVRIGPGSSGSALFDRNGNVIGINVAQSRGGIVIKTIPISYLQTRLKILELELEIRELDRAAGYEE